MNSSPRVSVCRSGRQHGGQGNCQRLARQDLQSQVGSSPQSSRAEPPEADAKGDLCGMEQHSGVWNSAVSAVVSNLLQLYLESGVLHPSGLFDKCLGTPNAKCGIFPGAYGGTWLYCLISLLASVEFPQETI